MQDHVSEISRVIQLAVAPVFLLTALATLIGSLNMRLGRIVDRRRVLLARRSSSATGEVSGEEVEELAVLARRSRLIYWSIFAAVLSALLVCLVVASAFLGALVSTDLSRVVATLFILAMLSMIASLGVFLREIYYAVRKGSHRRG